MLRLISLSLGVLVSLSVNPVHAGGHHKSGGDVSVHSYTRSNGTHVQSHMRSRPDGIFGNNWSTKGNVNPYTGQLGTKLSPGRSNQATAGHFVQNPTEPRSDQRISELTKAVNSNPGNALALSERGYEYHLQQRYDLAITDYSKAIELNKDEPTHRHNRGMVRLAKGDLDGAVADFNEAIRLKPSSEHSYFGLGQALTQKGLKIQEQRTGTAGSGDAVALERE